MLIVFRGVSGYAECDGNEGAKGELEVGGNSCRFLVVQFKLQRGLFCELFKINYVQKQKKKKFNG